MTQLASLPREHADDRGARWLFSRSWDRIFITGGALLVAVPILTFYLLRAAGFAISATEDLVTLEVMLLVGGPHVFATYTRTFLQPGFARRERLMFLSALVVIAIVVGSAISSAFFGAEVGGHPPMHFVLTFFFFWAGIHIVHQSSYCAMCYESPADARKRRFTNAVDYLVMLGCLYPVSFFRMSMIGADSSRANPDAWATQIVTDLTGSTAFADDYVFRIGRVAPVLPEWVRSDWFWSGFTVLFLTGLTVFVVKSIRQFKDGTINRPRFTLVAATCAVGMVVPLFPNLDSAFQGFNAWHSFQYLGLVWLWNRRAYERGEVRGSLVKALAAPGAGRRFYLTGLAVTLGLVTVILGVAWLIEVQTAGRFVMFGHDQVPVDPATGRPEYRPGSVLLAYYMCGFALLLVHYLHDGMFFFRKKDLVDVPVG